METPIAISVVVPAYNEEKLISRCLASLMQQDIKYPFEVIVVNNNSQDRTEEIAKTFSVRVLNEHVQGVVATRQQGLLVAKGEIVVGADCDSVYPPHWLYGIYVHFATDPHVVAVGGPAIAEKNPHWAYLIYKYSFKFVNWFYHKTGNVLYLGGFNFAFRRKTFLELGGYRTYLDFGGDEIDPLARLKRAGKVVYDHQLSVHIDMRRYREGFLRFLFVHTLYYYLLNYALAYVFKRPVIRAQPVRNK